MNPKLESRRRNYMVFRLKGAQSVVKTVALHEPALALDAAAVYSSIGSLIKKFKNLPKRS